MSSADEYFRIGVQVHQFVRAEGEVTTSRQIGLANNVHVAQRMVDALNEARP